MSTTLSSVLFARYSQRSPQLIYSLLSSHSHRGCSSIVLRPQSYAWYRVWHGSVCPFLLSQNRPSRLSRRGPFGAGAAVELGLEKSPVLSYIRSRGLYAGAEMVVQIFVARADENEALYNWPGVTPADIVRPSLSPLQVLVNLRFFYQLTGQVKMPDAAAPLQKALLDAETGRAQRLKGAENEWEEFLPEIDSEMLSLSEGEVLRLPPTPGQMSREEEAALEAEEVARVHQEREEARRVKLEAEEEADRRFFEKRAEDKTARLEQQQADENAREEQRKEASASREKAEAERNARDDAALLEAAKVEENARVEAEAAEERKRLA